MGLGSSVGIATSYGLDGMVIDIFLPRPDLQILLYDRHRLSLSGVKRLEHGVNHQPLPIAEVKKRVDLYLYSPSGPS